MYSIAVQLTLYFERYLAQPLHEYSNDILSDSNIFFNQFDFIIYQVIINLPVQFTDCSQSN